MVELYGIHHSIFAETFIQDVRCGCIWGYWKVLVFTHMFFFEIFAPALIKIFIASRCPFRLAFIIGVPLLRRRMSVWTYTLSRNAGCCKPHQAKECHYYILRQTVTTDVLSHVSTSLPAARRISQIAELPMKAAQWSGVFPLITSITHQIHYLIT